jgi:NADPH:quinone reductase-like Zn-dependent oxidoreductase
LTRARELGADPIINYVNEPNWRAEVNALTRGAGADDAVLVAGGDSVNQSLEALKIGGNVVIIGLLQDPNFTVQILPFILRQGTIQTLSVGLPEAFEKMNCAKIARMISQRYSCQNNATHTRAGKTCPKTRIMSRRS